MPVLRLAQEYDIEAVYALAKSAPPGLTTLPADRKKIEAKVIESVKNQEFPPQAPSGESFLFVLEKGQKLIGTSAVFTKVGGFQPFWTYALKSELNRSQLVGVEHNVRFLELKKEHSGPSEIGTLFLDPSARGSVAGRLLSLSRFLFIAQYRQMFEDSVLAELRGTVTPDGQAAFWDAIGAHFFGISYTKADMLVTEDKSFIDELMPKFPIYIDLLPKSAQEVLGVVAKETRPALALLEKEGFSRLPEVDIFEAGPIVSCLTDKIRTIKESKTSTFQGSTDISENSPLYLVANVNSLHDFRVTVSPVQLGDHGLRLPHRVSSALKLSPTAAIRYAPFKPQTIN